MSGGLARLRSGAGQANVWLPGLLAFALPLSTSAVSATALLILLLWLIEGNFLEKLAETIFTPVAAAALTYLGLLCLGLLWTANPADGFSVLQDHWKIALLPVFLTAVRHERRSFYLSCFIAGMTAFMLLTYLAWFGLVQYADDVTSTHLTHKTFHVVYNPLLAFAIYLTLHKAVWEAPKRRARVALFLLAGLMSFNMFITEGRTGQAAFFVLISLLLFQIFTKNRFRAVLAVCLLLPSGGAVGYLASPVFQQRVDLALKEISGFQQNPNTSVGLRLQFFQNSLALFRQQPCLGVGTGDFKSAYALINQERSPASVSTDNPHNQYLFSAVLLGLPGLLTLLLVFVLMLRQARSEEDSLRRARLAFPVFFLVIMLAESYLKVYQTAFFFALLAAVLYKKKPLPQAEGRSWLILSYRANIPGSACSQHLDDRLPHLQAQGIEPVLLTGPAGLPHPAWRHFRTVSLAPSGIRFELRHYLRRRLRTRWQFKLVETLLLLPVLPFYLLEKIVVNLESEWSWGLLASLRGLLLCRQLRPELIYSTGGSASAHVAALLIKHWTGIAWIAETQDPLVHDQGWRRSRLALLLYKNLEQRICRQADVFVFLVGAAMEHCRRRTGGGRLAVVYPGAEPSWFGQTAWRKGGQCRFAHFGSLSGTRNLAVFFQALEQVVSGRPELRGLVRVDVYGSFDSLSEREMKGLRLHDLVTAHGSVPRQEAIARMQQADCLLLVQNLIYFSCETIPSKVYEYLLAGRPILGLLHNNQELEAMLTKSGHQAVPADDVQAAAAAIAAILEDWQADRLHSTATAQTWTVEAAVRRLICLSEGCGSCA